MDKVEGGSVRVRITGSTEKGREQWQEEVSFELNDREPDLPEIRSEIRSRVSSVVKRFISSRGVREGKFYDPIISGIEIVIISHRSFETLSSLNLEGEFESEIIRALRQQSHEKDLL